VTGKTINDYPTEGLPRPWATWIPNRTPQFKVHGTLGQAKNAIGMEISGDSRRVTYRGKETTERPIRGGVIYEMIHDAWAVRAVVKPGSYKCEHMMYSDPRKWNNAPGITTVIDETPDLIYQLSGRP
jgi:hypothetical protein